MTFIRAKEIPPGSGNWYDYEVRTTHEGSHVRQKVVRYLGKSGANHALSGGHMESHANLATDSQTPVSPTRISKMKNTG